MNLLELQIGNQFYELETTNIRVVTGINYPGSCGLNVRTSDLKGKNEFWHSLKGLTPILIDSNWLEKDLDLFKNKGSFKYVVSVGTQTNKSIWIWNLGDDWFIDIQGLDKITKIKYRHELQNLIQILTGKSLYEK